MINSNNRLAVIVDQQKQIPALFHMVKELKLVERDQQEIDPATLWLKKLLVFNKKGTYDYAVEKNNDLINSYLKDIFDDKVFKVSSDFENIIDEVYLFAGKPKPKKEKKKMIIDITISLPKAKKRRKRKVTVFSNFVKVGLSQHSIKHDWLGHEYVIINRNRYEIYRDWYGKGYLVEL